MEHQIKNKPDYASLHLLLDDGEQIVTESGAMMAMDRGLEMETNAKGGVMGALKRAAGGESLFLNTYTSTGTAQRLDLGPSTPGDIEHRQLHGDALMVQSGSYMASTPEIQVDTKWGGAKTFFGGEGLFMLKCSGKGHLWFSSYGAIHAVDVNETYVVDTSHIVAFEDTLSFKVKSVGGLKSLFFSSEGLVCEFSGSGKLYLQTRSASALAGFLHPFRRVKSKNNN
jgi:uncharacterized protein (TIGR00266 family)